MDKLNIVLPKGNTNLVSAAEAYNEDIESRKRAKELRETIIEKIIAIVGEHEWEAFCKVNQTHTRYMYILQLAKANQFCQDEINKLVEEVLGRGTQNSKLIYNPEFITLMEGQVKLKEDYLTDFKDKWGGEFRNLNNELSFVDMSIARLKRNTNEMYGAMSGANLQVFGQLYNKNSHESLTKACRAAESYAHVIGPSMVRPENHYNNMNPAFLSVMMANQEFLMSERKTFESGVDKIVAGGFPQGALDLIAAGRPSRNGVDNLRLRIQEEARQMYKERQEKIERELGPNVYNVYKLLTKQLTEVHHALSYLKRYNESKRLTKEIINNVGCTTLDTFFKDYFAWTIGTVIKRIEELRDHIQEQLLEIYSKSEELTELKKLIDVSVSSREGFYRKPTFGNMDDLIKQRRDHKAELLGITNDEPTVNRQPPNLYISLESDIQEWQDNVDAPNATVHCTPPMQLNDSFSALSPLPKEDK